MTSRATAAVGGAALGVAALVLVAAGVYLRVTALDLGWFGVDQARDVATALDVAAGQDAPTVGPTMRRVVRLGAGYYYFWAVPYLVSRDPLAGYWFAATLSVAAMLAVAALVRRLRGPRAALVTLAFAATHPVWVIDGRVAWSPAALPAVGAMLLWLLIGVRNDRLSAPRLAAIGGLLGIAVQLHLTMVAWVVGIGIVVLLERPALRAVLAGVATGLVTGLPGLVALLGGSAHDSGITGLVAPPPLAAVAARLGAALLTGWRVPAAFSRWNDVGASDTVLAVAAVTMTTIVVLGMGRLAWREGRTRPARLVLAVLATGGALILAAPGEAWWYYLDGLLPVAALAAGGSMQVRVAREVGAWSVTERIVVTASLVAAVVLASQLASWLRHVDERGYMVVDPRLLTLDVRPGGDAAAPGRIVAVRWQRAFSLFAAESGTSFDTLWRRLHGPALGDVTGDNGFWLRWALAQRAGPHASPAGAQGSRAGAATHVSVWYADAPIARQLAFATGGLELVTQGPLRVARYVPAIDFASCRTADGPVVVPIRIAPHPKRYGDGRPRRPRDLPTRVQCSLHPGTGSTRVVARLDGPGTVRVTGGSGAVGPAASESAVCLSRGSEPRDFAVDIELPPGAASALDIYDVPAGVGCPITGQIAGGLRAML